jgi:hypothetical protein
VSPLQVKKSVAFQSRIQTFALSKGPTPPLAPVQLASPCNPVSISEERPSLASVIERWLKRFLPSLIET